MKTIENSHNPYYNTEPGQKFSVFIKLAKSNKVKKTIKLIVNDNFHIFLKIEMIL